ncbi:hypothetical protein [Streptomyces sp. NPDC039028]|uniref:hypothetical protein n=1 Tax=unclassified Streptomyces TaxID=2593676 RepID=UPI0033FE6F25
MNDGVADLAVADLAVADFDVADFDVADLDVADLDVADFVYVYMLMNPRLVTLRNQKHGGGHPGTEEGPPPFTRTGDGP